MRQRLLGAAALGVLLVIVCSVDAEVKPEGTSSSAYDEAMAAHSGPVPPAHFATDDPIARRENTKDDDPPEIKFRTPEEIQQKLGEWIDGERAHDSDGDSIPSGSDVDSGARDEWPKSRRGHRPGTHGRFNSQEERRRRREEAERLRAERIAAYNAKEEQRKAERLERIRKREEERKESEKLRAEKRSQSQSQRREREQRPTPPVSVQDEGEAQRRREEGKRRREERRQERMKDQESRSQSRTDGARPGGMNRPESESDPSSSSRSQPPPIPNKLRTGPGSSSHSFSDAGSQNEPSPKDRTEIEETNARHTADHKRRSDEKIAEFERKDRERKERFEQNRKLQEEKRAKLRGDHRDRLDPRGPRP